VLLDVQPDLLRGFVAMEEWGRIGTSGRMMGEWHMTEAEALAALQRQPIGSVNADISELVVANFWECRD
jgi:hypothetical protein